MSTGSSKFVEDLSHRPNKPAGKSCASATAVDSALHGKKNEPLLGAEEEMVSCKQFGFVGFAFLGHQNVINSVKILERGEREMVAATEGKEVRATKGLRSE